MADETAPGTCPYPSWPELEAAMREVQECSDEKGPDHG